MGEPWESCERWVVETIRKQEADIEELKKQVSDLRMMLQSIDQLKGEVREIKQLIQKMRDTDETLKIEQGRQQIQTGIWASIGASIPVIVLLLKEYIKNKMP